MTEVKQIKVQEWGNVELLQMLAYKHLKDSVFEAMNAKMEILNTNDC